MFAMLKNCNLYEHAYYIFRFDFWNDHVSFFVWIYEIKLFKLHVKIAFQPMDAFDLLISRHSHFLLSKGSLSFNSLMTTLTNSPLSACIVELVSAVVVIVLV